MTGHYATKETSRNTAWYIFIIFAIPIWIIAKLFECLNKASRTTESMQNSTLTVATDEPLTIDNVKQIIRHTYGSLLTVEDPRTPEQNLIRNSQDNINFIYGSTKFSPTLITIRCKDNDKKFSFNSDKDGLAIGFRDHPKIMEFFDLERIRDHYIDTQGHWDYYQLKFVNDLQKSLKTQCVRI